MRQERTVQASVFDLFAEHEIGRELKAMSQWLDEHSDLLGLVARDLCRHGLRETDREGLPAEAVLRCALLKQHRQLSYQELAFHLEDSASFRAFARSASRPVGSRSRCLSMKHRGLYIGPWLLSVRCLGPVPIVSPFFHLIGGNHPHQPSSYKNGLGRSRRDYPMSTASCATSAPASRPVSLA